MEGLMTTNTEFAVGFGRARPLLVEINLRVSPRARAKQAWVLCEARARQ
jgi:hypothetical protein